MSANYAGGEFTTRPLTFDGREVVISYSTSAAGSIRVEFQDPAGKPVRLRFVMKDCDLHSMRSR